MAGTGSPGGGPRTATMFACVTTLSNTLLGVSVVGVAGGFARAGCAVGTFYLILFACLAGSGLHLLARSSMTVSAATKRIEDAKAAEEEGGGGGGGGGAGGKGGTCFTPSSFRAVALVGAPRWAFLIDVSVALKCFGVATSYLVVIGDLMPTAMADILGEAHADSFLLDRRLWVTAGFLLAAPLAFSRTLGALKYTATLAISLVVFLAGMVMSFWIFPGLDACPGGGDSSPEILLEGAASDGTAEEAAAAEAGATEEGVEFSARGLLSSAAALAGMATPSPQVVGMSAGAGGDEFEAEGDGDSCFEGANAVGSVRTILQTLPIFVFCFTCHQNIFTICNEIVRPTPARVDAVIVCAMLVATTTYLSLSWGAYATFGVGVEGDLLETYPRTGLLTAARISVSILVMSCYPLQAHPSRLCILSTWKAFSADMQEAYAGLLAADEEGGNGHGSGVASSAPDAPVASIAHSGSGSDSSSSGRGGRGSGAGAPPSGEGERGRRRIAGGARREAGAKQSAGLSPEGGVGAEAEAQREAELEALLSDATQPLSDQQQGAGGTTGASGVGEDGDGGSDAESRGGLGGGAAPRGALSSRGRGNGDAESADAAQPGTVRGEVEEPEVEAFWTSVEGFRHILVTGAFLGLSYAIAMAVDDLGVLLEVVGATGSTTIAFILPGLLYLKVHPEPHPKRSLATLQLAVGLLIIPVALTVIALGESAEGRR